jgi:hypothetical protein
MPNGGRLSAGRLRGDAGWSWKTLSVAALATSPTKLLARAQPANNAIQWIVFMLVQSLGDDLLLSNL